MKSALIVLLVSALLTSCAPVSHEHEQKSSPQNDLERFQGTWELQSEVIDGQKQPEEPVTTRMTYTGDKWIQKKGAEIIMLGSSVLRPDRSPNEIDIMPISGPSAGKVLLGIYRFSDNMYENCFVLPGKERPSEFSSKPDTGHFHVFFKRLKP
jgi:uncharacterized protein (TIGR03067 family)